MDTLAHGLLGLNIANVGFKQRLGTRASYWTAAVAANAPDIDILLLLKGRSEYIYWHRGVTHSVLGLLLIPPLIAYVASRVSHAGFRELWLLSVLAQLSHLLLDLLNFWGTMLGSPLNHERYTVPWIFVFDVFIWAILALPLLVQWLRKSEPKLTSSISLATLAIYCAACGVGHARAVAHMRAVTVRRGLSADSVAAYPRPFWPTHWNGVASSGSLALQADIELFRKQPVRALREFDRGLADPLVRLALSSETGRHYAWFAPQHIGAPLPVAGTRGRQVGLYDLRFFPPPWAGLRDARNSLSFEVLDAAQGPATLGAAKWGVPWPEPLKTWTDPAEISEGAGQAAR
jgi:inner membrane protein